MSTSSAQPKSSRHVSFELATTCVHLVERVKDLPANEIDATWYDSCDLAMIRSHNNFTAKLMQNAQDCSEPHGHCFRGLEYWNTKQPSTAAVLKEKSVAAVLAEQQRQRDENDIDPDLLARIYEGYSILCLEKAKQLGKLDEEEVLGARRGEPSSFASPEVNKPRRGSVCTTLTSDSEYSIDMIEAEDDDISELSDDPDSMRVDIDVSDLSRRLLKRVKGFLKPRIATRALYQATRSAD